MNSDIGDRLGLLRDSCISKYDRLNEIETQLRDGEELMDETRRNFPAHSTICNMRVQLTELQLGNALIAEEIEAEMKKHENLREKTDVINVDLDVQMERHKKLAEKVAVEGHILSAHHELGMDKLNMLYEQFLMLNEEVSTLSHHIQDVENRSKTTNRIEWLKKIIRATQIQQKQDKSCLFHMENECKRKENSVSPVMQNSAIFSIQPTEEHPVINLEIEADSGREGGRSKD